MTHTPVKPVRMWSPTQNTGPWGSFFPQCVLYKQTELEKSSHWNIISSCHIWSVCLAACGLFNQSEHKGPDLQTCCEQTTVKGRAQAWKAPVQGANQPRGLFHELWLGRNVLLTVWTDRMNARTEPTAPVLREVDLITVAFHFVWETWGRRNLRTVTEV